MKRKSLKLIAGIILFSSLIAVGSTIGWFFQTATVEGEDGDRLPIDGGSKSGYFAYGNGTQERPYGIRTSRQLYNLAWLQYLGTFNNAKGTQYYFELANNLNMANWVLPPIGTESKPFIGNFNGKGFCVYNLTVSNSFSEYGEVHPTVVTSNNFVQPHIVGFFGVVGDYNKSYVPNPENPSANEPYDYSSSVNEFKNTALSGVTVKTVLNNSLIGIAAGYVDGVMSNIIVDSSKLNVAGSGTSVAFGDFTNISDYSLVGYTTKITNVTKGEKELYGVNVSTAEFNAMENANDTGWGGSIDMKSMYQRLVNIRDNSTSTVSNFVYRTTNNYLGDSLNNSIQEIAESGTGYRQDPVTGQTTNAKYGQWRYAYNSNANHSYVGNYNFYTRTSVSTAPYTYLIGGTFTQNNKFYASNSLVIKITDGTNYLIYNNGLANSTSSSDATSWTFSSNTSGTISTTSGANTYYLRNNNGTLTTATTSAQATTWTFSHTDNGLRIVSGTYELAYVNGGWRLITASTDKYCTLSFEANNNVYYLTKVNSGNTPSRTTTGNDAAVWYIENGTGLLYYLNGNNKLYLSFYNLGNNNRSVRVINSKTTQGYTLPSYNGSNYSVRYKPSNSNTTYTYYMVYNNSSNYWRPSTSTTNMVTPSVGSITDNLINSSSTTKSGKMSFTSLDTTYFPLNVISDGGNASASVTNGNYDPKDSNTGYVIAGSIMDATSTYGINSSSIRVSRYAINGNISKSFYSSSIHNDKVYTVNSNGFEFMTEAYNNPEKDLEKYADSKTALEKVLKDDGTYVYGLHFVSDPSTSTNISISKDNIVNASKVSILGNTYDNYQLPVYSIDFNLKEKGYINFFAGSYYSSTVTCFFSLHQILRNNDAVLKSGSQTDYTSGGTIDKIKEIKAIYGSESHNNWSYIYEYKDGKFSKPYRFTGNGQKYELTADGTGTTTFVPNYELTDISTYTSDTYKYTLLFDSDWISNFSSSNQPILELPQNYLYYFEIPMNDGEFCLGNVNGGDGGYLVYLDIGANASKIQRTIFYEKYMLTVNVYSYPVGVCLRDITTTYSSTTANTAVITSQITDYSDTACVRIKPSFSGELQLERNTNSVVLFRGSDTTNAPPVFAGVNVSIYESNGTTTSTTALTIVADQSTSTIVKRMQYYDYVINTATLMVSTITDTSTDGGTTYSRSIVQTLYNGNAVDEDKIISTYSYSNESDRDLIKIYNTSTGVRFKTTEIINQTTLPIASTSLSNTVILKYTFLTNNGTYSEETLLVAAKTNSQETTYYNFDNYVISVTQTYGDIVITVTVHDANYKIFINEVQVVALTSEQPTQTITVTGSNTNP